MPFCQELWIREEERSAAQCRDTEFRGRRVRKYVSATGPI
jgi:hypothetical protein